ncbi:TPA: glycoside hydrolase family 108 protein [Vibrio harveyi]
MKSETQIINELIDREGGYSNNPKDPGKATMWGWTEENARRLGYKGRMQDLPRSTAFQWYLDKYWIGTGFKRVSELSIPVAIELLDSGVNVGSRRVAKWLQRSLNVLNAEERLYKDLKPDGAIGDKTIGVLQEYLDYRGANGVTVMLRCLNSWQGVHYMTLAEKKESYEEFEFGWFLNRVD